jgi:hypothetical protein
MHPASSPPVALCLLAEDARTLPGVRVGHLLLAVTSRTSSAAFNGRDYTMAKRKSGTPKGSKKGKRRPRAKSGKFQKKG